LKESEKYVNKEKASFPKIEFDENYFYVISKRTSENSKKKACLKELALQKVVIGRFWKMKLTAN